MEVWVLHRQDTSIKGSWSKGMNDPVFVGVFANEEAIRDYILGWADYLIQDAKEFGSKEDVREAEREAAEIRHYYETYDFSKVKQCMFAKGFEVRRTDLFK